MGRVSELGCFNPRRVTAVRHRARSVFAPAWSSRSELEPSRASVRGSLVRRLWETYRTYQPNVHRQPHHTGGGRIVPRCTPLNGRRSFCVIARRDSAASSRASTRSLDHRTGAPFKGRVGACEPRTPLPRERQSAGNAHAHAHTDTQTHTRTREREPSAILLASARTRAKEEPSSAIHFPRARAACAARESSHLQRCEPADLGRKLADPVPCEVEAHQARHAYGVR